MDGNKTMARVSSREMFVGKPLKSLAVSILVVRRLTKEYTPQNCGALWSTIPDDIMAVQT